MQKGNRTQKYRQPYGSLRWIRGFSNDAFKNTVKNMSMKSSLRERLPSVDSLSWIIDSDAFHEWEQNNQIKQKMPKKKKIFIRKKILGLEKDERFLVGLYFWGKQTICEISDLLGVPEKEIKKEMQKALSKLKHSNNKELFELYLEK